MLPTGLRGLDVVVQTGSDGECDLAADGLCRRHGEPGATLSVASPRTVRGVMPSGETIEVIMERRH